MLHPLNRYLVVEPIEKLKKKSGILVPEGLDIDNTAFKLVKVIMPHVDSSLVTNMKILVPSHMVEQADFFGETHYLVLENHVVGFIND